MSTEGAVKESGKSSVRGSDWVWTLFPPVVFGLMGLAVAVRWTAMGDPYVTYGSAAAEFGSIHVFRRILVPWFCTTPALAVPLFVALRFWRFGGLNHRVATDGTFFRSRSWWSMTRTGLLFYAELTAVLLGGLVAGMILHRPPWLGGVAAMTFAKAVGLGLLATAVGVAVTIPTWIMFVRMLRQRIGSIWCLAFVFVSTSFFTWMVSIGGYLVGFFDALSLFIIFGALNMPLLFIVPARFGDSPGWRQTLRLRGRREWSRDQVHFLLGIVYLTILTALVAIVSLRVWPSYLPMLGWKDEHPWLTDKVMDFHSIMAGTGPSFIACCLGAVFLLVIVEARMTPGKTKSGVNMVVAMIAPSLTVAYLWITYMGLALFFNSYVAGVARTGVW